MVTYLSEKVGIHDMRKRIDLPGKRDITSILSEGKNKGWAQMQVGL